MPEVSETPLPGVGVRHEFVTAGGERVAVITHRTGRRELAIYDRADPDACTTVLHLSGDDTRTLAELLGASPVSEAVAAVQQKLEGLAIDWITVPARNRFVGATIAEGEFRTHTGASIVAVIRDKTTMPAPGPDHGFEGGDVIVAVGTTEGLAQLRAAGVLTVLAAAAPEAARAFIEIGAVALVLAALARLAGRLGITTIPFYLLAGLAVGKGGIAPLDVSADFIGLVAEIGVLLLLLTLGLEYTADELRYGLRTGLVPGATDAVVNFLPGFGLGLLLGWDLTAAVLLGGVCWVSSSGIVAKVLSDLGRLANRETPSILNLLVIEDLAMAVYLPIAAALVAGQDLGETVITVAVALVAVAVVLVGALRFGTHLSRLLERGSDEALLLAVFGLTLLVGGLAQELEVSAAIGAFLVGLALSGPVQLRAANLVGPLRDLFAAVFFLFFSFQIDPGDLFGALLPGAALAIVAGGGKLLTGWVAAGRAGVGRAGRLRAGSALIARGEFSIVIASLGAGLADGSDLGAVAAAFVLVTAIAGPLATRALEAEPAGRR